MKNQITETSLAREAIIEGETSRALSLLLNSLQGVEKNEGKNLYNDICIYSNAYKQLIKNRRTGTISDETYSQEINKINRALIETISEIELFISTEQIHVKKFDPQNSFSLPRNSIPNKLYYSYLLISFITGMVSTTAFFILYYFYLLKESYKLEQLLFIASIGITGSMFLFCAIDGINRKKEGLMDWRIILPHILISTGCLIYAGFITINKI